MSSTEVRAEWSIMGGPKNQGTMTFKAGSQYAWFVSDDGKTRTMIHREMLANADITYDLQADKCATCHAPMVAGSCPVDPTHAEFRELGELVEVTAPTCWCGGEVGPREPGDADGLGCLENVNHDWTESR